MSDGTADLFEVSLQDSELAGAEAHADTLVLRLSAAHVQRAGSQEAGFVQHLALWCLHARWQGNLSHAIGRIRHITALVDGAPLHLTAPGRVTGSVVLTVTLGFGDELVVHTQAVEARFSGSPGFRASLAC